jgi:hypothetical protein
LRGDLHALHPSLPQNGLERLGDQRVSIVDQVLGLPEKPVHPVGQVPRHLLHPVAVGIHTYPRDLHGTTLEGDDEEDLRPGFPSSRSTRNHARIVATFFRTLRDAMMFRETR